MWKFLISAPDVTRCPANISKEICVIGRSNVGKSSLINAVTGIKNLAIVSNTPGRTRLINYFVNESEHLTLVDLPGYGYAKTNATTKETIGEMLTGYFASRKQIRRTFLLIDAKVGLTPLDAAMVEVLHRYEIPFTIVLTKADKPTQSELVHTQRAINAVTNDIILTSARLGTNIAHLRRVIKAVLN